MLSLQALTCCIRRYGLHPQAHCDYKCPQRPPQRNISMEQSSGYFRLQWTVSYWGLDVPQVREVGWQPFQKGAKGGQTTEQLHGWLYTVGASVRVGCNQVPVTGGQVTESILSRRQESFELCGLKNLGPSLTETRSSLNINGTKGPGLGGIIYYPYNSVASFLGSVNTDLGSICLTQPVIRETCSKVDTVFCFSSFFGFYFNF